MFVRVLILIVIIYVCQCKRHHRDDYSIEEIFERIYEETIYMDKRFNKMNKYENNIAFERLTDNWYLRKILIKGFNKDTISIKIRHRVMYTKVENLYRGRKSLEDVKVLPFNLNTKEAFYEVADSKLYIYIPFSEKCKDRCNIEINIDPISVSENKNMSNYEDLNTASNNNSGNNIAGNANDIDSGNEINGSTEETCAVMVIANKTTELDENNLRQIFGELINDSYDS